MNIRRLLAACLLAACSTDPPAPGAPTGGGTEDPSDSETPSTTASPPTSDATGQQTSGNEDGSSGSADATQTGSTSAATTTGGPLECDASDRDPKLEYIWVANSPEQTVSKINTETLVEEGRYATGPGSDLNPSRTSVNFNGDVAVANRSGGITMIAAREEDCPGATTSSGADDVVAWPDGCVLWFEDFDYASQRPVAWTHGVWNEDTCRYDDAKVWTSGANASIDVILIDGDTGTVEATIAVPGVAPNFYGLYGGAVDSEGNFWATQIGVGSLVRVDFEDFSVQTYAMPEAGYGIAVDHLGFVWTCADAVARFDPLLEVWETSEPLSSAGNGCMEDGNGTLWVAAEDLLGIDIATVTEVSVLATPQRVRGVSIDLEGFVWGVTNSTPDAYRVDPDTGSVDTYSGLASPYTYSDMTGFGLLNAG